MAERTSFETAEQSGKSLSELIAEDSQNSESQVDEVSQESRDAGPQTSRDTEPANPDGEEPSQGSGVDAPEVTDEQTPASFSRYLRDEGFDLDEEIDEQDLYRSVLDRIRQQDTLRQQIEAERKEREAIAWQLEELRNSYKQPAPVEQQAPAAAPEKKSEVDEFWTPLEEVDRDLMRFVEQDPETGMYRAREQYEGLGGEDAAKRLNEYSARIKQRSQALLSDPVGAVFNAGLESRLDELIRKRAEEVAEEKFKSFGDFRTQAVEAVDERRQIEMRQERINRFWDEHASHFLKVNANGQPVQDLNGNYVQTPVGKAFSEEMGYIRNQLGVHDEEKVLQTAWRNVARMVPQEAPAGEQAAPEAVQPPVEKAVESGKDSRRRFVERRTSNSPEVPANRDGYSNAGRVTQRTKPLSLLEMVREDPEASQYLD